jgi:Cu+-exporting ATPase
METDPVCGMKLDAVKAAARAEYQGVIYYFCSSTCHKAFVQQPGDYLPRATGLRAGDRSVAS